MLNDTLGWCCGRSSRLLKTTNGGQIWQQVSTGYSGIDYWSLDFLNTNYGMISCSGGKVLKTTDGGNSWTLIQAGDTRALYTIDIIDTLHIASSGETGKNVYSSDGGINWILNGNLGNNQGSNRIRFINTDTGYVTGDLTELRKTTNRGQSWFAPIHPAIGEWDFDLVSGGVGYGVGSALTITRGSGGYDYWERLVLNENFADVYFKHENEGWFVSRSDAYVTNNGGLTVTADTILPGGTVIYFINNITGFYSTFETPVRVLKTTNGGTSWYQVNSMGLGFGKIFFINQQTGWAISGGKILKTTDSGENWFVQHTLPADSYTSIYFVDSLNGWATSRYIWQTTNGGNNWIQRSDIQLFFTNDIYFTHIDTGFVIKGFTGYNLYKTTNGGINWNQDSIIGAGHNFNYFPNKYHWILNGVHNR